ncbi:hypothetical protein [Achromobacter piechaudii]|uniref:KfrA N-terminal DNA-binding domain-containing protein n=2 Tax=Achromobacter piechaudii TaxID=72556 RepID=A0ABM8L2V4_9BURK|nr:hypothetical protein [Achromobacter piechaudii]CAB3729208.1 hypothetical protein LMG1873_04653 [Achromobacter piechaudii]CAB3952825.1 hypothetical protein LMG6103_03574 [Achromobacter piechaudii]
MIPAMNRQQRRMMEKQQTRVRATRRPRPERLPMLIKTQQTLAPLESIIDQIERDGTVTVDMRGVPVFHCVADGEWYASAPAIAGMADFFDMWATRHSHAFQATALRQLAARLEASMPIDGPLMAALHREIPALRRIGAGLTQDDASDLLRQTQIRAELDASAATGA